MFSYQELETVFSQWPQLHRMDLRGNPVCHKPKYRDRLIIVCKMLGKSIEPQNYYLFMH